MVVLTDGADGHKNLVRAAIHCEPRSSLDWFHITMRLLGIEPMVPKDAAALHDHEPDMAAFVHQKLPSVHQQMWNGQWPAASARMKTIYQGGCKAAQCQGTAIGEYLERLIHQCANAYRHARAEVPTCDPCNHRNFGFGRRWRLLSGFGRRG